MSLEESWDEIEVTRAVYVEGSELSFMGIPMPGDKDFLTESNYCDPLLVNQVC